MRNFGSHVARASRLGTFDHRKPHFIGFSHFARVRAISGPRKLWVFWDCCKAPYLSARLVPFAVPAGHVHEVSPV